MKKLILSALSVSASLLFSCETKKTPEPVAPTNYLLATDVPIAGSLFRTAYLQLLPEGISTSGNVDNSKSIEVSANAGTFFVNHKNAILGVNYTDKKLKRFVVTNGAIEQTGSADFTSYTFLCIPTIWTDEVAFQPDVYGLKISIFNPATMTKTGEIDLSSKSRMNEVTNVPATGDKIGLEGIQEILIRDNKMYVALYYLKSATEYVPSVKEAYIAIFDLNKINKNGTDNISALEKIISDNRLNTVGSSGGGFGARFMVLDENKDIYVLGHNYFGFGASLTGQPSAIVRIKSGASEFDKDYFFDLTKAGGNNYSAGLEYYKNGDFLFYAQDPSKIDANNPYSIYTDPIYKFYKGNLYTKSSSITSLPHSKAASGQKCYFEGNKAYVPFYGATENSIYEYDMVSGGDAVKKFGTSGNPAIFKLQ